MAVRNSKEAVIYDSRKGRPRLALALPNLILLPSLVTRGYGNQQGWDTSPDSNSDRNLIRLTETIFRVFRIVFRRGVSLARLRCCGRWSCRSRSGRSDTHDRSCGSGRGRLSIGRRRHFNSFANWVVEGLSRPSGGTWACWFCCDASVRWNAIVEGGADFACLAAFATAT